MRHAFWMTRLQMRVVRLAWRVHHEHSKRRWSFRTTLTFRREVERRKGLEKHASEILWKLRNAVRQADKLSGSNPDENLLVQNPASELISWVRRHKDAVESLGQPQEKRRRAEPRSLVWQMFRYELPDIDADSLAFPARTVEDKGPPLTAISVHLLGTSEARERGPRELAAIGILCGVWDEKYDRHCGEAEEHRQGSRAHPEHGNREVR